MRKDLRRGSCVILPEMDIIPKSRRSKVTPNRKHVSMTETVGIMVIAKDSCETSSTPGNGEKDGRMIVRGKV